MARYVFLTGYSARLSYVCMYVTTQSSGSSGYAAGMSVCERKKEGY